MYTLLAYHITRSFALGCALYFVICAATGQL